MGDSNLLHIDGSLLHTEGIDRGLYAHSSLEVSIVMKWQKLYMSEYNNKFVGYTCMYTDGKKVDTYVNDVNLH